MSWITADEAGSNTVVYWSENNDQKKKKKKAEGKVHRYKFSTYTSGYIHHCPIRNLQLKFKTLLPIKKVKNFSLL